MSVTTPGSTDSLFRGEGEMARLLRAHAWAESPLGEPRDWPQSLRTAVAICLTSRFPIVLWWGRDLRLIYNDAWRPALGEKKHPAVARPGREVWAEIWHLIGPMLEGVLETGEATWSEDMLLPMDRHGYLEETYWTYSYSPIVVEDGSIGGVFTAVTETTQRVLAERRLQALRDLGGLVGNAQTAAQASALIVDTLDGAPDLPYGAIVSGAGEVVASSFPAGLAPLRAAVDAALAGEVVDAALPPELGVARGAGSAPAEALALPLRSAGHDRVIGALVAAVNPERALDDDYRAFMLLVREHAERLISGAQALEEERRRSQELAELDRAKTDFFSNVSHELRTPLTLILGPLEDALADGRALPAEQRETLEVIRRNALRLLRLVNTLLDFSRIQADRVVSTFRPVDLAATTTDLASSFRSAAERAGLLFETESAAAPAPVYVDAEAWEKIVLNLLSNALKFTPEGAIRVAVDFDETHARLRVADTGTGIAAEELPRLFERFHRVRTAGARSHEGTGIGLALVSELVDLHGGTIDVESTPGVGTTFTIALPLGHEHLPPDQVEHVAAAAGPAAAASPYVEEALRWVPETDAEREGAAAAAAGNGGRARIVIADDNADMRDYLVRLLEHEWRVHAYPDGAAALAAIRADPPDLVVSDVMMPALDGFGLLTAVRADAATAGVPVVLVSARAGEESAVEGLDAGADDYLVKPFSARELRARVRANLELARLRREAGRLSALDEVRSRVITTVSHELRTPVTSIYGATKTLERIGLIDAETQRDLLAVIGTQAERLARITSDILTTETLATGILALAPEPVDAHAAVVEAVAARRTSLPEGLELHAGEGDGVATVVADRGRLQQVLTNLLDNAIKYSPDGGAVTVAVERVDGRVRFVVADEGLGIAQADREQVFARFYRADPNLTGGVGGSGLGLYICRELVEAMHGRIWVEPNEPRGSRFVVSFPAV